MNCFDHLFPVSMMMGKQQWKGWRTRFIGRKGSMNFKTKLYADKFQKELYMQVWKTENSDADIIYNRMQPWVNDVQNITFRQNKKSTCSIHSHWKQENISLMWPWKWVVKVTDAHNYDYWCQTGYRHADWASRILSISSHEYTF